MIVILITYIITYRFPITDYSSVDNFMHPIHAIVATLPGICLPIRLHINPPYIPVPHISSEKPENKINKRNNKTK